MARFYHHLLLMLSFFFLLSAISLAKSYSINRIEIVATVLPDGSMTVQEQRSYAFRGSFSWADYQLPLSPENTIINFSLSEAGMNYQAREDQLPGSYYIRQDKNKFYVRWYYSATNEIKTFTLHYTFTNAITRFRDTAELYYKFVGEANTKDIDEVLVTIQLPLPATPQKVRAWAHGPLWGTIEFSEGKISLHASPLQAHQFFETRILFPPDWVPLAKKNVDSGKLAQILKEEAAWAKQANEERRRASEILKQRRENEQKAWPIAVGISLLGIAGFAFFYHRFGRGFRVAYYLKVDSQLPDDFPPAVVSALYFNRQITGRALVATLFDLARGGLISIEQQDQSGKSWWQTNNPEFLLRLDRDKWKSEGVELLDYENDMVGFLFDELSEGGNEISAELIKKSSGKMRQWFRKWKNMVKKHFEDELTWDRESIRGTVYSAVFSLFITASGILIVLFLGTPGFIPLFTGILLFGLSFFILRYTPEAKIRRKKWKAFRRYMNTMHFTNEYKLGWQPQVSKYLVYGLALGVRSKAIEKMVELLPVEQQVVYLPWYLHSGAGQFSAAEFSQSIASIVSVATSTMSSASGAGGGASVGGGGGAGGASGGAG